MGDEVCAFSWSSSEASSWLLDGNIGGRVMVGALDVGTLVHETLKSLYEYETNMRRIAAGFSSPILDTW